MCVKEFGVEFNHEKVFRDLGSGFGVRRIGARDDIGMKNKMFASNKPGMI